MFDEQPDGDPHGECALEIKILQSRIAELEAQVDDFRKHNETLTNQVLCCGVAASHSDATLTTRGAYAGKWNSAQAEDVRKLRAERDALRVDAERYRKWRSDYTSEHISDLTIALANAFYDWEIDAAIDAAMKDQPK